MTNNKKNKDEFETKEINENKSKTILIKKILWYVSTIIVILLAVFGSIRYLVKKGIEENIGAEKLETVVETQLILKTQNDSLLENIKEIKALIKENTETIEGLSNSYIIFMQNNKSLTKDDFRSYMEGVTWEVKKRTPSKPREHEIVFEADTTLKE